MSTIGDRFKEIARYKELTVTEFEVATGLSNGLVGKLKNPSIETILKVAKRFPDVSLQWILTGDGDMLSGKVMPITDDDVGEEPPKLVGIPFLDGEHVAAGVPDGEGEPLSAISYITFPGLNCRTGDFAVRANGRSMVDDEHPERSIPDGSIVVVTPWLESHIEWGETYCVATRNGYFIKRLQPGADSNYIKCVSNNEREGYLPYEVHIDDIVNLTRVTAVIKITRF